MKPFTIINKVVVDDGWGGTMDKWVAGATIYGALVINNSPEMQIAQAMGSTNLYTLTVEKNINLDYHMVLERVEDKAIFRITSNSDDNKTPESALLNMRQYSVEEWRLTGNE